MLHGPGLRDSRAWCSSPSLLFALPLLVAFRRVVYRIFFLPRVTSFKIGTGKRRVELNWWRKVKMRREAALRTSLLALAVLMVAVGIWTFSLTKMLGTYAFGISGIAVILLPDWEFFDRDFSQWFTPMPARRAPSVDRDADTFRFKFYPLRVTLVTLIYGIGLYKWWKFLSN